MPQSVPPRLTVQLIGALAFSTCEASLMTVVSGVAKVVGDGLRLRRALTPTLAIGVAAGVGSALFTRAGMLVAQRKSANRRSAQRQATLHLIRDHPSLL
jgi:hypothetical protein